MARAGKDARAYASGEGDQHNFWTQSTTLRRGDGDGGVLS